mmetsp:Transcript_52004/g.144083  ORF Transcript_52004/g.144083 Transcript_52004/m.144083 type:complete len:334 (-) Transcript_52004:1020-2021(-)
MRHGVTHMSDTCASCPPGGAGSRHGPTWIVQADESSSLRLSGPISAAAAAGLAAPAAAPGRLPGRIDPLRSVEAAPGSIRSPTGEPPPTPPLLVRAPSGGLTRSVFSFSAETAARPVGGPPLAVAIASSRVISAVRPKTAIESDFRRPSRRRSTASRCCRFWMTACASATASNASRCAAASSSASSVSVGRGSSPWYSTTMPDRSSALRVSLSCEPPSSACTELASGTHVDASKRSSSGVECFAPVRASSASPSNFCAKLSATCCHMKDASWGYCPIAVCMAECGSRSARTDVDARADAERGAPVSRDCSPMTTPMPRMATTSSEPSAYSSTI